MSVIGSFQVFDQIKMMTGGGPAYSTRLAVQHVYDVSFKLFRIGDGAAMSFMLFVIILVFTSMQVLFIKVNKD
jgi:multiple sugar transport system permease protein